ncbi:NAD(P)/FAD-dependent oxidoreductase [Gracilibacillus alcaliphilus]|uniref:NAD(P)/FAD-dependent oxidoreductase n=1 Tax=Gracilibacillus alcaliphilus TaxID=1401441 RepID=UPI00195C5513|nr:NAD(P)/FAD-dependent oxidoreductase [Gracilibacillus alcaliphilus]MBM7679450.1 thioredoxin reductase (NADPH) [Gracilibacillus alcaliphilus]
MRQEELYDVTIIGAGPAGLFSAFYSGLREMKTKVIEYQDRLGGKVHVYPEKMIWDIGALTPVSGEQLIEQMVEQAETFDPTMVCNEKVTSIAQDKQGIFTLHTASGAKHWSKTVIIAIGGGILNPQKLEVDGAEKYEISNLSYTIKSLKRFKDKTVLISGGGHTAVDWANELESIAKKVYLVYRKNELNAHEAQVTQLMNSSVECLFDTDIKRLIANDTRERIQEVEVTNKLTNQVSKIEMDELVVNHGFVREKKLLEESDLNIEMANEYFIASSPYSETSVPGIYGAGDVIKYDGKVHLIAGAFQDAVNAVNRAKQFIEPTATESGMVSSHNDIFKKRNKKLVAQLMS